MPDTLAHADLESASAIELARAVAGKRVSAAELTESAIARIEKLNPPLNAVVVKDYDRARTAAKMADARVARGEAAPLLGVPMTVKDSHDIAGLPTTWGFPDAKDFVPNADSVAIERLKHAGAVILGKTNIPTALGDWQSNSPVYGVTNNPHDLSRTPGGSSGGGAAAVASGMVPIEFGSDIGGSIRIPAAFCGIYGHKTSYGLVPTRGHAPPRSDGAPADLGVVGPLARTPEDLALVVSAVAGPDTDQAVAYKLALPLPRHQQVGDYRVLVIDTHPVAAASSDIRAAIDALASAVSKLGAKVSRKSDLVPDLGAAHLSYQSMLGTVISRRGPGEKTQSISAHEWLELVDIRYRLRRQWRDLFQSFDVVVAPAFGTVAFPHVAEPNWSKRTLRIDGKDTPYGAQLAWPGIATFPGLPATAIPLGKDKDGLPLACQVIGPDLEDATPLDFARLVQDLH